MFSKFRFDTHHILLPLWQMHSWQFSIQGINSISVDKFSHEIGTVKRELLGGLVGGGCELIESSVSFDSFAFGPRHSQVRHPSTILYPFLHSTAHFSTRNSGQSEQWQIGHFPGISLRTQLPEQFNFVIGGQIPVAFRASRLFCRGHHLEKIIPKILNLSEIFPKNRWKRVALLKWDSWGVN
jgi:hypothetical protein